MAVFAQQQEQMRAAMQKTMGNFFPFSNATLEEVGRQNMAMVERAMSLFSPFYRPSNESPEPASPTLAAELEAEVERLRKENEELRRQLASPAPVKTPRKAPASSE